MKPRSTIHPKSGSWKTLSTRKSAIARYWLDTPAGIARFPENPALNDLYGPRCFACEAQSFRLAEYRLRESDPWSIWDAAYFDRCHIVPRALGGEDDPQNLVLLCSTCHRDAPNVGEPQYMIDWMTAREYFWDRHTRLVWEAIEIYDLHDQFEFVCAHRLDEHQAIYRDLLRTWTGTHGIYVNDSTMMAATAEAIRRASTAIGKEDELPRS